MDYQDLMKFEYLLAIIVIILFAVFLYFNYKEHFASTKTETEPVEVMITPIEYTDAPEEIHSGPVEEIKTEYIEGPPVTDSFYVPEPFDVASEMAPLMDEQ